MRFICWAAIWLWFISFSVLGQANTCLVPVSPLTIPSGLQERDVRVTADLTQINQNQSLTFSGNVDIATSEATIHAQFAHIDVANNMLTTEGEVDFANQQLRVSSQGIELQTLNDSLNMQDTHYRMTLVDARGSAEQILINQEIGMELNEVTFTTCPEGNEDWLLKASSIAIAPDEPWGKAKNTRFYVGGVPVFYLPYFIFPVTDARQSGLLVPSFSTSSESGFGYEQPVYWNIAPNYDFTFSPRLLTNRGLQLKNQFRYLSEEHQGQINLEYLAKDDKDPSNDARYFYRWSHNGKLFDNWWMTIDYNGISDQNYVVDLGSDFYNQSDTYINQTMSLSYFSDALDMSIQLRDFDTLGQSPEGYRALPEMKMAYRSSAYLGMEFKLNAELAYFDTVLANQPQALRFHVAPTISIPYRKPWGELNTELSVMNTYYRQQNINGTELAEEVNRIIGQGKLSGRLQFERKAWFDAQTTQTLEPRIQYLYTSYQDRSKIGLYDTTRLINDFGGLFRGRDFTGLDRISDKNQFTLGVTSRFIDGRNNEILSLSLGQIFFWDDSRLLKEDRNEDRSALAGEIDWVINSNWFVHSELQLSQDREKLERSSLLLEYRQSESKLLQFNHRFVRDLSGETINQLGVTASWSLSQHWHGIGRWYQDIERERTVESYAGIKYQSCCWSVSLVYQRHLLNRFDPDKSLSNDEFDNSINLLFSFNGMGESNKVSQSLLRGGLFGYRQPYPHIQ